MKKIRMSVGILLLSVMVISLTACGSRRNTTGNGTGGTTTTQSATGGAMESTSAAGGTTGNGTVNGAGNGTGTTNGTNGTGNSTGTVNETTGTHNGTTNGTTNGTNGTGETGTGVIGGLMNDVERGVENITGGEPATTQAPTNGKR